MAKGRKMKPVVVGGRMRERNKRSEAKKRAHKNCIKIATRTSAMDPELHLVLRLATAGNAKVDGSASCARNSASNSERKIKYFRQMS